MKAIRASKRILSQAEWLRVQREGLGAFPEKRLFARMPQPAPALVAYSNGDFTREQLAAYAKRADTAGPR